MDDLNNPTPSVTPPLPAALVNKSLEDFADKLIEEKDFPDITPEVRVELKNDILRRLDDFLAARIIAALSDTDVAAFEELLKQGKSDAEIQAFTTLKIPDFTNFLTNTLLEFRGVYLGIIDAPTPTEAPQNVPQVEEAPSADQSAK